MRVLLDTNVVLDVLLRRGDWVSQGEVVWQESVAGRLEGCITASSLTDVFYIARRLAGQDRARQAIRECLDALTVLSVGREDLECAYGLAATDFEDAVQISATIRAGLDAIVTRDPSGFAESPVPVWSPSQLVASLRDRPPL